MSRAAFPSPGTDNWRLLEDLLKNHPTPSWDCNSRLGMTAHSRASDLRRLGWVVVHETRSTPRRAKKLGHGYALARLPRLGRSAIPPALLPEWDQAQSRKHQAA